MLALLFFEAAATTNLLLGFIPESIGLLIFGIGLIAFAVSLRWFFNRAERAKKREFTKAHLTVG